MEETKRKEDEAKRVEEERRHVTRLLSETANAQPPPASILQQQPRPSRPAAIIIPGTVQFQTTTPASFASIAALPLNSPAPTQATITTSPPANSPAPAQGTITTALPLYSLAPTQATITTSPPVNSPSPAQGTITAALPLNSPAPIQGDMSDESMEDEGDGIGYHSKSETSMEDDAMMREFEDESTSSPHCSPVPLSTIAPATLPNSMDVDSPDPAPGTPTPVPMLPPFASPVLANNSSKGVRVTKRGGQRTAKSTRVRPTLKQKRDMIVMIFEADRKNGNKLTRTEAAELIREELGLLVKPTFITNLRKNHEKILERIHFADDDLKTVKKDRLVELHNLLEEFHDKMEAKGAPMNDQLLIEEAKTIAAEHNLNLPSDFKFSDDWFLRFKRQRGIGQMEMHGEAGDACLAGIELCRRFLPHIFEKFNLEDIYNGDESGLFFRQLPTRALMKKMRKGKKSNKLRATLNFIVNALGTDIHIQLIGCSARPRAFGKTMRPYDSYGIDYYNQKNHG